MKNKFIRIVSPITLAIALALDFAVVYYIVFAFNKLEESLSAINIIFSIIALLSVILAFFYSRESIRHGVKFRENEFEITFLDDNNIIRYCDIEKLESFLDTKASLKKNFVDRYSKLIISLKDGNVLTLELGMTTKKKLKKIEDEIRIRMENA
ncbi:MAG: hypothetical protein IKR97_07170 [Eubacterium sp.]|nr:hypothetical protein [Eubacterium sp.]